MRHDNMPIVPDPNSVTPAVIPTIPAPIPVSMPKPDASSGTALKVTPKRKFFHKDGQTSKTSSQSGSYSQ